MGIPRHVDCTGKYMSKTRVVVRPLLSKKQLFHVVPYLSICYICFTAVKGHCQLRHWMHWCRQGKFLHDCHCASNSCPIAVGIVVFPKVMALNGWGLALTLIASWMITDADRKLKPYRWLLQIVAACGENWGNMLHVHLSSIAKISADLPICGEGAGNLVQAV